MSKISNQLMTAEGARSENSTEQLLQEAERISSDRSTARLDRRKLITHLSLAAGAAGMLGVAGCSSAGPASVSPAESGPSVLDVLNFALNLEYFEASFYSYVVTGSGIPAALMGTNPGTVTGGAKVSFKISAIANIAANLMTEEVQHVQDLITTINTAFGAGSAVALPTLNLAAMGAPTTDATFVALARSLETVGVSAYAGGAQYLTSNTTALTYAAQILDVEAQHEGALRQACIYFTGGAVASPAVDAFDQPPTGSQLFNTGNTTGLVTVRTVSQVLGIVYGASTAGTTTPAIGITKGGFFPNGFNGNLYST